VPRIGEGTALGAALKSMHVQVMPHP